MKDIKKISKYLLLTLIVIGFAIYFLSAIYRNNFLNNINEKDKIIENVWNEYLKNKNEKNQKFLSVINSLGFESKFKDSLLFFVNNKYKKEKKIYKSEKLKSYIGNEYFINKYSLILSNNMNLKDDNKTKSELISLTNKCNFNIETFNRLVKDFNCYRSIFPNFFIANKRGLKNLDFIDLVYGKDNKNPNEKSNIDNWIETGDAVYLEKEQK